jgi:hypothetical protein
LPAPKIIIKYFDENPWYHPKYGKHYEFNKRNLIKNFFISLSLVASEDDPEIWVILKNNF